LYGKAKVPSGRVEKGRGEEMKMGDRETIPELIQRGDRDRIGPTGSGDESLDNPGDGSLGNSGDGSLDNPGDGSLGNSGDGSLGGNAGDVKLPGPGWRAALETLGESGMGIARLWSSFDYGGMQEGGAGEAAEEEIWWFGDELRLGARWRRYGRCGVACALLRQAGRRARPRRA
jgi:hypothetical protein